MALANDLTTFICLFHDSSRGRAAITALEQVGISSRNVTTLGGNGSGSTDISAAAISELGVPDRDLHHLEEGLRKGGLLVSLQAPEESTSEIERIFHHYNADKIDEAELNTSGTPAVAPVAAPVTTATTAVAGAVIPVAEEELIVGRRQVDRGGVRVLRRVVEEPVSESVHLHGERVTLDRRAADRPATSADLRAADREIELVETAEVPVVNKVARVVEEVHVGKVETEHTEVVQDTIRHTEVQLEPVEGTTRPTR